MHKDVLQWLVPVLLAVLLAGALWFYWWRSDRPAEDIEPSLTEPQAPLTEQAPAEPVHPLEGVGEEAVGDEQVAPLPSLQESDDRLKLELFDVFGEALDEQLADRGLVERIVATVDNLPRDRLADRIRPMSGLSGGTLVEQGDGEDEYLLSGENYARYDGLVGMVENADIEQMEQLYRRFYPLFQEAYVDLGYPQGYFNDRVIEVIDHLLATPEPEGPIRLVRPHVLYEYADPELEALSPGQKLLLRMGNEHASRVKEKLREFRTRIVLQSD